MPEQPISSYFYFSKEKLKHKFWHFRKFICECDWILNQMEIDNYSYNNYEKQYIHVCNIYLVHEFVNDKWKLVILIHVGTEDCTGHGSRIKSNIYAVRNSNSCRIEQKGVTIGKRVTVAQDCTGPSRVEERTVRILVYISECILNDMTKHFF